MATWIETLPDSVPQPKNHTADEQNGKAPIRVSYRIEPSALQPKSPAQPRVHRVATAQPEVELISPLSLDGSSLHEHQHLLETGSGASFLPSCGLSPHVDMPAHSARLNVTLATLGTDSPALSLDGSFSWLHTSTDELETHLKGEDASDSRFGSKIDIFGGRGCKQQAGGSGPGLRMCGMGMFQTRLLRLGGPSW